MMKRKCFDSNRDARLYHDLSWLWPLWGEIDEYKAESEFFGSLIKEYSAIPARTLLDIACGGGKNDFHFTREFEVTGLDVSGEMLDQARRLNPGCTYEQGDMRSFKLQREFDSIFFNDGIVYMKSTAELKAAFERAFMHLKPGGILLVPVEAWKETFYEEKPAEQKGEATESCGRHNLVRISTGKSGEIEVTFIEHLFDPDRTDDSYEITFIYLIRDKGKLRVEGERHIAGLFSLSYWKSALRKTGFEMVKEEKLEEIFPVFVCRKP